MEITRVIIKPYLTEKTYSLKENFEKQVITFLVDPRANKHQIENAFIAIYGVKPEKINTVNKKPARMRTGTLTPGYTKFKKVAYVVLPKGTKIALTEEEAKEATEETKTEK